MNTAYLDVPHKKWGVVVIYNYDTEDEQTELLATMRSFGMTYKDSHRALDILSAYNTGMAISSDDLKMSAIYISKSTSQSQFWDTVAHELRHVADAIIDYYGVDSYEDAAYLTGHLMKEFVLQVGEPCY